ncbi:MAG: endonuclease/exonuclease/phosphatase family protein, partial [Stackebrandtia sp.]
RLRVMTVNLLGGGSDLDTVADLVAEHKIDVLSVQELTTDGAKTLSDSGVGERLPYELVKPGLKAEGTGIYSRFELTENKKLSTDGVFFNPAATLDVPKSGELEFQAVHPAPPINVERTKDWKADLRALPRADNEGPPRVLAGDFNSTLDHKTFGELLDSGYRDAGEYTGSGLTGTWPADKPIPRVAIDHVLTTPDITPTGYEVHTVPGGDHRAITTTLALPGPGG